MWRSPGSPRNFRQVAVGGDAGLTEKFPTGRGRRGRRPSFIFTKTIAREGLLDGKTPFANYAVAD